MRRFKLINSQGVEWDLTRKSSWLQDPSGLGMSRAISTLPAGHGWIETDNRLERQMVSGDIVLSGYEVYSDFTRFCAQSPLTFCYKPLNKWYYRSCHLAKIGKTEINFGNKGLICPVDFICTSAWYESAVVQKTELDASAGKKYPYTYPYTYAETSAGALVVNNSGSIPSPCRLHIMGPCANPSWAITQGAVLQRGKVTAEIPAGNKIVVDSRSGHMELSEYTVLNEFVQNLYPSSDFSTARFILIPPGESTLSFTHEGVGVINAFVEVNILAATV